MNPLQKRKGILKKKTSSSVNNAATHDNIHNRKVNTVLPNALSKESEISMINLDQSIDANFNINASKDDE